MITDKMILDSCIKKGNKNATVLDVIAYRRFMKWAECEDAETIEEADMKIDASFKITEALLMECNNPEEERQVFCSRYKNL